MSGREHQALHLLHNYWERRAAVYDSPLPDVLGRNIIAAYLRKLKPCSLVEVGCGNGQLFSAYKDVPHVVACDWSENMLKKAEARRTRHNYSNIRLKQLDITKQTLQEKFDVALTRTVLMHIPPDEVEMACRNLTAMSDTIMLMEFFDRNTPRLEWHCFHHEYATMMDNLGYVISEIFDRPDGIKQLLMIFKKA